MDLEQRLASAYEAFKNKVDAEEHARFQQLITSVHEKIWDAMDGKVDSIDGAEFAHAVSLLDPGLSQRGRLPSSDGALTTQVRPDGTLLGTGKWEILDPGWIESLIGWFEHLEDRAPFMTSPVHDTIPDQVSLCLAGDWGTGVWRNTPVSPSEAVGDQMSKLAADITLHLGDVYYAGTAEQERDNLTSIWPYGTRGSYTLNSNHEMYDGAISYFAALKSSFTDQGGCSYFVLENSDWLVVGLDSAYHSDPWNLYMDGKLGKDQIAWLSSLPPKKGIILTSHHTGTDLDGAKTNMLYDQVMGCLNGPDGACRYENVYWYWGHAHNAVIYKDRHQNGSVVKSRCIGHAAIPYGDASELKGKPQVAWYETKSAEDPTVPVRVLNGFAHVTLNGPDLSESLIAEDGSVRWSNG